MPQTENPFRDPERQQAFRITVFDLYYEYQQHNDTIVTLQCSEEEGPRCSAARDVVLNYLAKKNVIELIPRENLGPSLGLSHEREMAHQRCVRINARELEKLVNQLDEPAGKKKDSLPPIEYKVSVNDAREVYINDIKLTKRRPHPGGENAWLIKHLCDNPDIAFTRSQLNALRGKGEPDEEKRQRLTFGKPFKTFASNLCFRGDIQKIFLEFSDGEKRNIGTILLRSPVTVAQLEKLGFSPDLDMRRLIADVHRSEKNKKAVKRGKKPKKT